MKVDTEGFAGQWTESLSIRIQLPLQSDINDNDTVGEGFAVPPASISAPPYEKGFARSSPASLMALRKLPPPAPLVLFTPVIPHKRFAPMRDREVDPFEKFGRELAKHHPNISHVPYIGSVGFTKTHLDFVVHSAAVIVVVWEPNRAHQEDLTEQEEFAEAAFDAFKANHRKGNDDVAYVLVQYAADGAESRVPFECPNVIETRSYDREAVRLANDIFGRTSRASLPA